MRRFSITVNNQAYDVVVEEVNGAFAPAAQTYVAPAPVAAAPVAAAPAPVAAAPAAAPASAAPAAAAKGEPVKSPMPGTILDVKVLVGQAVKKGDVLCILEAMKLENEIRAPRDGAVSGVSVSKGSNVNAGDTLVTIA